MTPTALGAPAVRFLEPEPVFALTGVRRDVAAFAGVAARGPCRAPAGTLLPDGDVGTHLAGTWRRSTAVPVESWTDYRRLFGGFEGQGLLPYAVSVFFAQGGRRAYVIRMVHDHGADDDPTASDPTAGAASGELPLTTSGAVPVALVARSEGTWGDAVTVTLSCRTRPLRHSEATVTTAVVDVGAWVPEGTTLRATYADGTRALGTVATSVRTPNADRRGEHRLLTFAAAFATVPDRLEVVAARLDVLDGDPTFPRWERHDDVGLVSSHPRWLARVLVEESSLLWPTADWASADVVLGDPSLPAVAVTLAGGEDRSAAVTPEDAFDPDWVPGDEVAGDGVQCLAEVTDVGILVVPDLYSPAPLAATGDIADAPSLAGATFGPCLPASPAAPEPVAGAELTGLRRDPSVPEELDEIVAAQQRLIDYVEQRRDLVALLDVPPGLDHAGVLDWRARLASPLAAAYHPWAELASPDDARDALVEVNPSACAAGILAARELAQGIHVGPANVLATGAVGVTERVPAEDHDELHLAGVNVLLTERDGVRLTGARTLAVDRSLRQLNVVRFLMALRLTLERELAWVVFEPNGPPLWAAARRLIEDHLTAAHRAGALAGAKPADAFFVRCGPSTMSANDLDNGRFVAEVGVAVAEPVEYVHLRLAVERDTISIEVVGG